MKSESYGDNILKYYKIKKRRKLGEPSCRYVSDNVEYVGNMILDTDKLFESRLLREKINNLKSKNKIVPINKNFNDNILKNTFLYGYDVYTHLKEKNSFLRCHACVIALTLCLNNYQWIYGDLKNTAYKMYDDYQKKQDNKLLGTVFESANMFSESSPVYNHSYMRMLGKDIIEQNLVSSEYIKNGFSANEKEIYVIDPRENMIMSENLYNSLFEPNIFQIFKQEEVENAEIWKLLNNQKTQSVASNSYTYFDFRLMMEEVLKKTNDRCNWMIGSDILGERAYVSTLFQEFSNFNSIFNCELYYGFFDFESFEPCFDIKMNEKDKAKLL